MDYKQIIKDIQAKNLKPIYLLHGEEAYFIDRIIDALENVLTEVDGTQYKGAQFKIVLSKCDEL